MGPLRVLGAALLLAHGRAASLRRSRASNAASLTSTGGASLSRRGAEESAPITLFCFSFFPGRPMDVELLPEVRLQLEKCDRYMFFTDEESPVNASHDIAKIKVPQQRVGRGHYTWLYHRNMAAVTPVWSYLLEAGIPEKFDWTLHVELDHFTRPVLVRRAILETLETLRGGSPFERSFLAPGGQALATAAGNSTAAAKQGSGTSETQRPMMLAFGNAFLFNRGTVKEMKAQWPLPGMTEEHGCPTWSTPQCAQDMVYPRMLNRFVPPVQLFGPTGCGKVQRSEKNGKTFPFTCWEFYQNPYGEGNDHQTEDRQLRAIAKIAEGAGRLPSALPANPNVHNTRSLMNLTNAEAEAYWPSRRQRKLLEADVAWETYFPPRDVPIIHHVMTGAVAKEARKLLGI